MHNGLKMRLFGITLLLFTSHVSWAHDATNIAPMELCTPQQTETLVSALNQPAFVPRHVQANLERGECRQINNSKMLAFAVFLPQKFYPDQDDVSPEARAERSFTLVAGLFDTKKRRIVSRYKDPFESSGWIEIYGHQARVIPTPYGHGKPIAFAISHGSERAANAADFHVSEQLTLLMQQGASLKAVLHVRSFSQVALTGGGGICCAHVVLETTRTLAPTQRQTLGMPDLELRAERDVRIEESQGPAPPKFTDIPRIYSYTLKFNGQTYQATPGQVQDAWDTLDE